MPLLMRYISSRSAEHAITELRELTTYAEPKTYESNNENMNNANRRLFRIYGLLEPAFPLSLVA